MADIIDLDDHRPLEPKSPVASRDVRSSLDPLVKADGSAIFYAGVGSWTISRGPDGQIIHTKRVD
jgi:hypothetical protein